MRREKLGKPGKLWSRFLGATVAYGYRPYYALGWLAALVVIGSLLFGPVFDAGATGEGDLSPAKAASQVASFDPVIYTVDLILPVISLGQGTSWNTQGAAQWVAMGMTLSGWLLTVALLSGITARRA